MRKNKVSQPLQIDKPKKVAMAEDYFRERAERADPKKLAAVLKKAGRGKAPIAGDEIS
ncbi:MAG TPA: hypothetical protein VGL53_30495 [Bryobacteraceae bacterium]|jgi:hypothetical protein